MAKVYGSLPSNQAEEDVVLLLKDQLPPDWVVLPSIRWAKRNERGFVRDGEADVVLLIPSGGMLVIEIKGSREIRVSEDGWQRLENGQWHILDRSPVEQATSNAHDLKRILCDSLGWRDQFPGLLGWMAVYPNGNANSVPALFDHTTLATRRHMAELKAKTHQALMARGPEALARSFSLAVMDEVARTLTSSEFRIVPADGAKEVGEDKEAIETLTRQQFSVLRGLFELPSIAVAGPAGSGKTVLAVMRLDALVKAGHKVLYVCFNKDLAESLRLKYPELSSHIHSINQLFGRTCPGLNVSGTERDFYGEELPNYVFDEVSAWNENRKFDAVLVDEAQDLSESQVLALQSFRKANGTWAVFLDRRQDIYQRRTEESLAADVMYRLSHNCRNTVEINKATNAYVGGEIDSMPGMSAGVPVEVECIGRGQMANFAFQLAREWKTGGKGNSVAFLSPYVLKNSVLAKHPKGHGIELTEKLGELQHPSKAYFSTVKSFKGIEADCVVVVDAVDPNKGSPAFTMEDLYVACTRARTRLVILTEDKDSLAFLRKIPAYR